MPDRLERLRLPDAPLQPSDRFARRLFTELVEAVTPLIPPTPERQEPMTATAATVAPPISMPIPNTDPHAMIQWLVDVLGFRLTALFEEDGVVHHSQVAWKSGAVQVSGGGEPSSDWPKMGPVTVVLTCDDAAEVDRLYERAVAAGAEVFRGVEDTFYGNHGFTLKDPFGNLWAVGVDHLSTEMSRNLPIRRI